jgi:hypothetical protein
MFIHDENEQPDMSVCLTMPVWTPTPDELAIHSALEDEFAQATTPRARNEARRQIDKHFREMRNRHRDDPPTVSVNPAADEARRALQIEALQKQLDDIDNDPPLAAYGSPSSN